MFILTKMGGVKIYDASAASWEEASARTIVGVPAKFNSDVYWPDVEDSGFVLPIHRGDPGYTIHLLETGALVIKEGHTFLCIKDDGAPRVLSFKAVPRDRNTAGLL